MLDGVSLDQLRTFIAAVDEGSFSAAGRRLHRAQSVVSQTLANLEGRLGVKLFHRRGHFPVLTDQGRALLDNARAVAGDLDRFKAWAKSLAGGLEPELSVAVDVMFPVATFTGAVAAFQKEFPATLLSTSAPTGPADADVYVNLMPHHNRRPATCRRCAPNWRPPTRHRPLHSCRRI
jgi:DNA-binding transcriptional LysR family regulator